MYLKTLGALDLTTPAGTRVNAVVQQPRRLALLVYLAMESCTRSVRRDTLLATFWPDCDHVRASRSLSQALHYLRRVMGSEVFSEPRQEDVRVDPTKCSCDAAEFLAAVAKEKYEDALNLYTGDFLTGFHPGGMVEFQQWQDCQQARLRRFASESALKLASLAAAERNALSAAVSIRRSVELLPFDEAMLRRRMEILNQVGDAAGALGLYDSFQRAMKLEFAATPSRETAAFAASISCTGQPPVHITPRSLPQPPVEQGQSSRRGRVPLTAGSVIAVVAFAGVWGLGSEPPSSPPGNSQPRIALLDFVDYQPDGSRLAGAIATEVTGRIAEVEGWSVTNRVNQHDPTAREHESYAVNGGVLRLDSGVRVTAVLSNHNSGATIAHKVITVKNDDAGAIVEQASVAVAEFVRTAIGHERTLRTVRALRPRAAVSLLELGLAAKERGDSLRTVGSFEAAESAFRMADSMFAQAQMIARGSTLPSLLRAETSLRLMWLYIAPPFTDHRRGRAVVRRGLSFAQRAVAQSPSDLDAVELRGVLEHWLWQLAPAQEAREIDDYRRASESDFRRVLRDDPRRVRSWALLSAALLSRGEFAQARVAAERAYATDAYLKEWRDVLLRLFSTAIETGDSAASAKWCSEIRRRNGPGFPTTYCELVQLTQREPATPEDLRSALLLADSRGTEYEQVPQLHAHLHMLAAIVAARAADGQKARALVDGALEKSPHDPEVLLLRAMVSDAVGDRQAAIGYLRSYVAADPARNAGMTRSARFSSGVRAGVMDSSALLAMTNRSQVQ